MARTRGFPICRKPCSECPWRKDNPVGVFPVERYQLLAGTSRDMARSVFACHMTSLKACAGFLLSTGAAHNLTLRMEAAAGRFRFDTAKSLTPLYASYRDLAVANGVAPDDPFLEGCR